MENGGDPGSNPGGGIFNNRQVYKPKNNINNRNCIYGLILKPSKKAYNMFMDVYNNNIFNRQ